MTEKAMATLQDLINLAKTDGGKFFIMDEQGNVKLVIMNIEDYQRLLLGKLKRQVDDIEAVNRKIMEAQLQEEKTNVKSPSPNVVREPKRIIPDLRAEVIDPSFDFEAPKMEIDDL